jgi:hypothetical protein
MQSVKSCLIKGEAMRGGQMGAEIYSSRRARCPEQMIGNASEGEDCGHAAPNKLPSVRAFMMA